MSVTVNLPIGIDEFEKLRQNKAYYIDKTYFIKELLTKNNEVTLITRPRRFGKTLTQSMLAHFLDITKDSKSDFEGLNISDDKEFCAKWQNKYPVIFFTFNYIEGLDFNDAFGFLKQQLATLFGKYRFLLDSDKIPQAQKDRFEDIEFAKAGLSEIKASFNLLTVMLQTYYGKPAIILLDEYDVPLAKAVEHNYYEDMINLLRGLLGTALKTNPSLKLAVLTGCLRVSKESIFTGLNNLYVDSITDERYDEYLGFTQTEVCKLLEDVNLSEHADELQTWYDGYRFGKVDIYCPWDVICHVAALQLNPHSQPKNYWQNTSGNGVIKRFIEKEELEIGPAFETLLAGGYIKTIVNESLTYDTIESTPIDFWSLLFMTGYLTKADIPEEEALSGQGELCLCIPNEEVKMIFKESIVKCFNAKVKTLNIKPIFEALWNGDAPTATELITDLMFSSISYHDYSESYYHAFMTGLFAGGGYPPRSNVEMGQGRADLVINDRPNRRVLIFEFKYTKNHEELENKCAEALQQITDREYIKGVERGYRSVLCYGIAFAGKECLIKKLNV